MSPLMVIAMQSPDRSLDELTVSNYTLVNIKDWCKNSFEVVSQLRINTDYSHHRYDVLLLINGVPVTQIVVELWKLTFPWAETLKWRT